MKFYNREDELAILSQGDRLKSTRGIMTMLIGRRRVGKTTLALQKYSEDITIYLFVSKKTEQLLCEEFVSEISNKLGIKVFGTITKFEDLFEYLLELGKTTPFTLIIDEFQEFYRVNPSIFSSIQKLWDLHKERAKIHFVACGSVYSLMKKIYEDVHGPLFGRADFKIDLKPFKPSVLKEILLDHQSYSAGHLFDLFLVSGGIAKYIENFILHQAFDIEQMIDLICSENSIFLDEGKNRLIEEFGKEYTTYFSILSLIASSKTSRSEIESILEKNISGHLFRLENDYHIIRSVKPINAKPNAKVQKYEIVDNFLAFWFRFIFKYQSLIESENFPRLREIIRRDIDTFRGRFLEKLFVELFKEQKRYTAIGSYWERGNQNEIDIVAIDEVNKKLLICEVKLQSRRANKNALIAKSKKLLEGYKGFEPEYRILSPENLEEYL
ncbi:MAG: ATP-binding protein [Campylobacterales bacterium]|nr:ATP-binding protein [Campylobacterales bacterium]HEO99075.1 ATPase [Campylobacterota bacterium]